jgi:hypothetical protein
MAGMAGDRLAGDRRRDDPLCVFIAGMRQPFGAEGAAPSVTCRSSVRRGQLRLSRVVRHVSFRQSRVVHAERWGLLRLGNFSPVLLF